MQNPIRPPPAAEPVRAETAQDPTTPEKSWRLAAIAPTVTAIRPASVPTPPPIPSKPPHPLNW